MDYSFGEYLEKGTQKILEIVSSTSVSDEEKTSIIEAFSAELSNNIGNIGNLKDSELLVYEVSLKHIDAKISEVLANVSASYDDYERAISLCARQKELIDKFHNKGWNLSEIANTNIESCMDELHKRQDSASLVDRIIDEDHQITKLIKQAQEELSVKLCELAYLEIDSLEKDLELAKSKKVKVKKTENKDLKKVRKKLEDIKANAEKKELLHRNLFEIDGKLYNTISNNVASQEQWLMVLDICRRIEELLNECRRNNWSLPTLRCGSPDDIAAKYSHYIEMKKIDEALATERDSLSTNKQYKNFYANCTKQKENFDVCKKNGWGMPLFTIQDPEELLNAVHVEKRKKDNAKKWKNRFIIAGIAAFCILIISVFGVLKYRESKVQIPFDSTYIAGEDLKDIKNELQNAGFTNITERQDSCGWLESGKVISVSIDNSDSYRKGKYVEPEVSVVITISSQGRKYVTNILEDWKNTDYETVLQLLEEEGFTNITFEEVATSKKEKADLVAKISLNNEVYTNEHCYLPTNAPINITYYAFKIGIGNESTQFIGQDCEVVVDSLKESGFTNVRTEKITTGWAKGKSVVGVTVNNVDTYSSNEIFDPNVKIVVKYSSDDRKDITAIVEDLQTQKYDKLQSALKEKGFNNITTSGVATIDKSQNLLVSKMTINNDEFVAGDCFVQTGASIKIKYYFLTIKIENSASDIEGSQYADTVSSLKAQGFTNIKLLRANNLLNGWITEEGSIKSIRINGNEDFDAKDVFRYDAEIVIVVNTFKDEGCKDITEIDN
ncbi:hypothetical protein [Pseudobutyrivibrio sp. MD2005]|uniref:hypothetical protein n=1 Tax=Pseudobutyrivibrio sp. MD2005 TaxID=1410616 RepID=UPI0004828BEA|nr:hypothetical protein [Pseudobutyrivibrio sp. MD2005]